MDAAAARRVRSLDLAAGASFASAIDDLYADALDVLVARAALPAATLAAAAARLDRDDSPAAWARPNAPMPIEDLQVLGTDTPATPTYQAPRGATLEAYLDSAEKFRQSTAAVFGDGFDPIAAIRGALARFAGGRPVEVAKASDGRHYVPFTIRRMTSGRQIGIHHDYHYPLALYRELAPEVDRRTLVSYVVTLQAPQQGGELFVYGVTPDTPGAPKLPNGFSWDLARIEAQYDRACCTTGAGDLFLLASGRCLHRVGLVGGPAARVTMGGFLALDARGERVLFWS